MSRSGRRSNGNSRPTRWFDRPLATVAVFILAAGAASGCAGKRPHPAPGPVPTGPIPVLLRGAGLVLPMDRYLLTPPQSEQVAQAHRTLLAQCMVRFGLTLPHRTTTTTGPRTLNERRYGITDPDQAAVAGYRLSNHEPSQPPQPGQPSDGPTGSDADATTLAVLSGEGDRMFRGQPVPDGGCYGETRRRLDAGAPAVTNMSLAQSLAMESFGRSRQDPAVQAVIRDWSQCMLERGFQYPGPLDVAGDRRFRGPIPEIEIATANADIACKRQTNLVGVWFTIESGYQRSQIAANQAPLDRIRQVNDIEIKVARGLGIE